MFSVTVRDHMLVAHTLRGEAFGPAPAVRGATYVVDATFSGDTLDADGVLVDIARAAEELSSLVAGLTHRNLDDLPELAGLNTTTEVLAQHVGDRLAERVAAGALGTHLTGLEVSLRESHVARASYARRL